MGSGSFPPLPTWKPFGAFRLGTTSFVYPDEILPNVEALAGRVQDVELVLFEAEDESNLPDAGDIRRLVELAAIHDLTYTVHFPVGHALGSPVAAERAAALAQIRRVAACTAPLNPYAYLLHIAGIRAGDPAERVRQWQQDVQPLLAELAARVPDPGRISIENLDYPLEWCDPFLAARPFSVCTDAGHLWQGGRDWRAHLARYLARTRVVHLYGVQPPASIHAALDAMPFEPVRDFVGALGGFAGVLTLETFGFDETRRSMERLAQCLPIQDRTAR